MYTSPPKSARGNNFASYRNYSSYPNLRPPNTNPGYIEVGFQPSNSLISIWLNVASRQQLCSKAGKYCPLDKILSCRQVPWHESDLAIGQSFTTRARSQVVIHINILCISHGFYFFPFEKEAIFTTTDKNIKQPCVNNRTMLCILPDFQRYWVYQITKPVKKAWWILVAYINHSK